jgi:hypothetical protein
VTGDIVVYPVVNEFSGVCFIQNVSDWMTDGSIRPYNFDYSKKKLIYPVGDMARDRSHIWAGQKPDHTGLISAGIGPGTIYYWVCAPGLQNAPLPPARGQLSVWTFRF